MLKEIEKIIRGNVEDFCKDISNKYQIPYDELIHIWESSHPEKIKKRRETTVIEQEEPSGELVIEQEEPSGEEQLCPKIMKKGKNKGKKCGNKSRKNCVYCSKHKNFEGTFEEEHVRQNVPSVTTNTNIMKWVIHPVLNLWWDPKTAFVKKSENDDTIIGKCVDNKRVKLTVKDKKLCTEKKLVYMEEVEEEVVEEVEEESRGVKSEIMRTLFGDEDIENVLNEIQE